MSIRTLHLLGSPALREPSTNVTVNGGTFNYNSGVMLGFWGTATDPEEGNVSAMRPYLRGLFPGNMILYFSGDQNE